MRAARAAGNFGEWQHPAIKAALGAGGPDRRGHRTRVIAQQAQILLLVAVAAPLLARFVAATCFHHHPVAGVSGQANAAPTAAGASVSAGAATEGGSADEAEAAAAALAS
mmetsp:Transcript_35239/g.86469  ORF Transcript_35239/g.86469 Transcript_35239/m.86469 type:complete len:110 (+) Transcript_35239:14-343(+)